MTEQQEFKVEEVTLNKKKYIVVSHNDFGYVTIDLLFRVYRPGCYSTHGDFIKNSDYIGRGWKDKLIADACEYLRGLNER